MWSPDGRKIFYHLTAGPFIVAPLSYSPTLHVVRRDTLIRAAVGHQLAGYSGLSGIGDASPDGTRLLAALVTGDRRGLVVVPDWRPELARRMHKMTAGQ